MDIHTRLLFGALVLSAALPAHAQTRPVDLSVATIEDLMNIEITSASRKEQRIEEVPAAVYVITRDDIRRSGMTSVPVLLRLVPGVQVAQMGSRKWDVSVRGFNGIYSDKLLVLVDGRSLYNPGFSAVLWDTEDLMLEDVDRIEVIRGPGAAVWGTNAVNGVINIMTRASADTTGVLVRAGDGTFDRSNMAIRYGMRAGSGAFRTYVQLSTHGNSAMSPGVAANDHWHSVTTGFRGDWSMRSEAFMLESSVSRGEQRPLWVNLDPAASVRVDPGAVSNTQVGDVLGRWTHTRANGATLQLQSFVDISHRHESIGDYQRHTIDLDTDYHTALGRRHDLVIGAGYRYIAERIDGGIGYSFNPNRTQDTLVNAFGQDEISFAEQRVKLTLGAKIEHGSGDETTMQPTGRLLWNVTSRQHAWVAVSRALHSPSLVDVGVRVDFPPAIQASAPGGPPVAVSVFGDPAAQNESLVSTEGGYRVDIASKAAISAAGFVGRYRHLQTSEPSAPNVTFVDGRPVVSVSTNFRNLLEADTKGIEITGRLILNSVWQADGTFSAFNLTPHPDPASHDPRSPLYDGSAPTYQWRGHSAVSLGSRGQADVLLFHAGPLKQLAIPSYTRVDARLEWKLTPELSAAAQGQNLLSRVHAEFAGSRQSIVSTQVPRSGGLRLTWQF